MDVSAVVASLLAHLWRRCWKMARYRTTPFLYGELGGPGVLWDTKTSALGAPSECWA
jgi:hypothetical protein